MMKRKEKFLSLMKKMKNEKSNTNLISTAKLFDSMFWNDFILKLLTNPSITLEKLTRYKYAEEISRMFCVILFSYFGIKITNL